MARHREREEQGAMSEVRTEPPERQVERQTRGRDRTATGSGATSGVARKRGSDLPLVRVRPVPQDRGEGRLNAGCSKKQRFSN